MFWRSRARPGSSAARSPRRIAGARAGNHNPEVGQASDGEEALNLLLQQGVKPDLVLLDLILPKKNGFEVLETIRQEPTLEKLPVIIISNLGQPSDIERGKSLGVIDYFVKARLSIDELVNKVKEDVATNK